MKNGCDGTPGDAIKAAPRPEQETLRLATAGAASTSTTSLSDSTPSPPMATTPYFHWPPHSSSDAVAGFTSGAPELMATPATTAVDTGVAVVSPERAVPTRTRVRRNSSGSGKHQAGGGHGHRAPPGTYITNSQKHLIFGNLLLSYACSVCCTHQFTVLRRTRYAG
jgi:hypothetical protein